MITLTQHPTGHFYHMVPITVTSGSKAELFAVLFGPFSALPPGLSRPLEVLSHDGWITKGSPRSATGDRDVDHHQISGSVSIVPFMVSPAVTPYITFDYKEFTAGSTKVVFSHLPAIDETLNESSINIDGRRRYYTARISKDGCWTMGWGYYDANNVFRGSMYSYKLANTPRRYHQALWQFSGTLSGFQECPHFSGVWSSVTKGTNLYTPNQVIIPADVIKSTFLTFNSFRKNWVWYPDQVREEPDIWSDLVQDCVDQVRYVDVNTLSYVNELRDVAKLIPKLPLGKKALSPKAWASAYLCLRYGLNLTVKDTKALHDGIVGYMKSSRKLESSEATEYARHTSYGDLLGLQYSDTYHYKVTYRPIPSELMDFVRNWDDWGVYPTLSRMWDMVPLSFVLDWFAKVQNFLEQIDTAIKIPYYKVLGVCWSRKVIVTLPARNLFHNNFVVGQLIQTHYRRGTRKDLHPLRFRIELAGEFRNYWEALALIIVNKR